MSPGSWSHQAARDTGLAVRRRVSALVSTRDARYAGRSAETIRSELAELARDGVLEENQLGGMTVYSLAQDDTVREMLEQFVKALDDRQFRVKAIYHIIRGMR